MVLSGVGQVLIGLRRPSERSVAGHARRHARRHPANANANSHANADPDAHTDPNANSNSDSNSNSHADTDATSPTRMSHRLELRRYRQPRTYGQSVVDRRGMGSPRRGIGHPRHRRSLPFRVA